MRPAQPRTRRLGVSGACRQEPASGATGGSLRRPPGLPQQARLAGGAGQSCCARGLRAAGVQVRPGRRSRAPSPAGRRGWSSCMYGSACAGGSRRPVRLRLRPGPTSLQDEPSRHGSWACPCAGVCVSSSPPASASVPRLPGTPLPRSLRPGRGFPVPSCHGSLGSTSCGVSGRRCVLRSRVSPRILGTSPTVTGRLGTLLTVSPPPAAPRLNSPPARPPAGQASQ